MPQPVLASALQRTSPDLEQYDSPARDLYNEMLPSTDISAYDADERVGAGPEGAINIHAYREFEIDAIDYTYEGRESVNVMALWSGDNKIKITGDNHGQYQETAPHIDPDHLIDPPASYKVTIEDGAERIDFEFSEGQRSKVTDAMTRAFEGLVDRGVDHALREFTRGFAAYRIDR